MYALIISTDRRKKEPKKNQEKNEETNETKQKKIGAKNHKTQTQKITKGGDPGGPGLGRLLCTVLVRTKYSTLKDTREKNPEIEHSRYPTPETHNTKGRGSQT